MKIRNSIHVLSVLLLAALLCGLFPAAYAELPQPEIPAPRKVILDTDIDYFNDDAIALFMLAQADSLCDIQLLGVTTVSGNVFAPNATTAALRQLEMIGREDIPVFQGADMPLAGFRDMREESRLYGMPYYCAAYWDESRNDFADLDARPSDYRDLHEEPPYGYAVTEAREQPAWDFIIEQVHAYPGEVTILEIGPATNIATALEKDPTLAEDAAGIIYMGGDIDVPGNATPAAETNWYFDPDAIKLCLGANWKSQIVVPDDLARRFRTTKEGFERLAERRENDITELVLAHPRRIDGEDAELIWDPLVPAIYLRPDLLTELQTRYLTVDAVPGLNSGRAVSWVQNEHNDFETGKGLPEGVRPVYIAMGIDEDAFWDYFADLLSGDFPGTAEPAEQPEAEDSSEMLRVNILGDIVALLMSPQNEDEKITEAMKLWEVYLSLVFDDVMDDRIGGDSLPAQAADEIAEPEESEENAEPARPEEAAAEEETPILGKAAEDARPEPENGNGPADGKEARKPERFGRHGKGRENLPEHPAFAGCSRFGELPGTSNCPRFGQLPGTSSCPWPGELPGTSSCPWPGELPGTSGCPWLEGLSGTSSCPWPGELPGTSGCPWPEEADMFLPSGEPSEEFAEEFADEDFSGAQPMGVGLANPWTDTEFADTAMNISGVDFKLPGEETLPPGMELRAFRAMNGIFEADYTDGEEEMVLRASNGMGGFALSGDYNTYSTMWTENIGGLNVDCRGDGETANLAAFKIGDTSFTVSAAIGREGAGLTADELEALVTGLQAKAQEPEEAQTSAVPPEPDRLPEETEKPEKNGDIMILYTSDVHCGIDEGFGYAGLQALRDSFEAQGYTTILVDDGDAVQGEAVGTLSKGEAIMDLMNALHYDVVIPGNHEFDYGMDQFMKLVKMADFPYISCNFNKEGELVFEPFVILNAAGKKIAFVGVTTPQTLTRSAPANFQDENGKYIYGFMQDETGKKLQETVQNAVDSARAEGADYVYVLGHLGNEETARPYTYADIIANTDGIDVFLDGHSHDTEQVVMKNKDGKDVPRSACGTKLNCIGYSHISASGEIVETGIWSWPNKTCAAGLFGVDNDIAEMVKSTKQKLDEELGKVVAHASVDLTTVDPEAVDNSGNPVRIVRRMETNLGDFCADAFRQQGSAQIGITNGGSVRTDIKKGDVTYRDIINVYPFNNGLCVMELSGQQILDALEWGCRKLPDEFGGFPQVSGLSFEIHTYIDSGCTADENDMCTGIEGERRVKNVTVDGEPLDPEKTYTVAGQNFMLLGHGDGYTAFDGGKLTADRIKLDNQMLIDYIADTLGGEIDAGYEDPYGDGRIVIVETAPAAETPVDSAA